jgi:hypothetical protein
MQGANVTTKGLKPVPMNIRLAIARLVQLHYETHPKRIAASVGLTSAYCTRLWRHTDTADWPHIVAALQIFKDMRRAKEGYAEHEADNQADKGRIAAETCCACAKG